MSWVRSFSTSLWTARIAASMETSHVRRRKGSRSSSLAVKTLASERGAFGVSYGQAIQNGILVDEFLRFVKIHNPELLEVIRAIQTSDTYGEAQHAVGLTERFFIRARSRLVVLYSCFDKGKDPPRQRKVYRSRTPRTKG
jgi:hypothetical protein